MQMGGYQGIRDGETIGIMPFTCRPAHGLKSLWLPRLEFTGMLALRPAQGFQMHCIPRGPPDVVSKKDPTVGDRQAEGVVRSAAKKTL